MSYVCYSVANAPSASSPLASVTWSFSVSRKNNPRPTVRGCRAQFRCEPNNCRDEWDTRAPFKIPLPFTSQSKTIPKRVLMLCCANVVLDSIRVDLKFLTLPFFSFRYHRDLTIVCRIDLNDSGDGGEGGFIPMWLYVKTIGYTAAESVYKMRRALIREHKARLQQEMTDDEET